MENNKEKNRMKELVKSFSEKHEIIKESQDNKVNPDAVLKEAGRLKEIARIDEWISNPTVNQTTSHATGNRVGHGETVNTFMPDTAAQQNVKMYNPNFTYLQPGEALRLCIKRTIESGAPINNLGFYEEVNWNLNNMGFNSRLPIDIKNAIKKMIND